MAHTRSRNEKQLSSELTLLQVFNYLPLANRITRSRGRRRLSHSQVPVFPGYLFFKGNEDHRYLALRTNRIARILEVVDQEQFTTELERIHFLLTRTDTFEVLSRLAVGAWGRIISGPLQGLEGVVVQHAGRMRLGMNVTILGQSVLAEVEAADVEPAEPSANPVRTDLREEAS